MRERERERELKSRNDRERTNTTEMQKMIRENYGNLYAYKLDNLKEMDKFLETFHLPKLKQEYIENLDTECQQ